MAPPSASEPRRDHELVVEPRRRADSRSLQRRTTKTMPVSRRSRSCSKPSEAQHLGARALGEFEIIGVIDDARRVGVLVIDADREEMDAVADVPERGRSAAHGAASSLVARRQQIELRAPAARSGVRPR